MERDPGTEDELTGGTGDFSADAQNYLEAENHKFVSAMSFTPVQGPGGQLCITYVTGSNTQKDFRVEEGEKLLYMLKSWMYLKVQEHGELRDIIIREGDMFILPPRIPHCALPFDDTVCMVMERQRMSFEAADYIRHDINEDLGNLCNSSVEQSNKPTQAEPASTGPHETDPGALPQQFLPGDRGINLPFNLKTMLRVEATRIEKEGKVRLFDENFESDVYAVGGRKRVEFEANYVAASWTWQFRGTARFVYDGLESDVYSLTEGGSFFVPPGHQFTVEQQGEDTSYTIVVTMDPRNKTQIEGDAPNADWCA